MPTQRRKLIILTVAVTAIVGIGLGTSNALADTRPGPARPGGGPAGPRGAHQPAPPSHNPASRPAPPSGTRSPSSGAGHSTGPTLTRSPGSPGVSPTGGRSSSSAPAEASAPVAAVFAQINRLRADNGLSPLSLSDGLNASAAAHNQAMINGGGLSHQCTGEAGLGERVSAQGVRWNALGENIGESGRVTDTDEAVTAAVEGLTTAMYNETSPNDGHRRNLLNTAFAQVGIAITRDSSGTAWMTQDFSS